MSQIQCKFTHYFTQNQTIIEFYVINHKTTKAKSLCDRLIRKSDQRESVAIILSIRRIRIAKRL